MLKSTPLVQFPAVNCRHLVLIYWLCKTKKEVAVSLHNFRCILISR